MYNYSRFLEELKQQVAEKTGEGYIVDITSTRKNNGVLLDTLQIRKEGELFCPNLYLNQWYECCLKGVPVPEIADRLLEAYHASIPSGGIDPEELFNTDLVLHNVVYRLINYSRNEALLQEVPYRPFLDLALVYYVMVHNEKIGDGAILIRTDTMKTVGLTAEEIDRAAGRNTARLLPPDFITISDLLREFGEKTGANSYTDIELEEDSMSAPLHVLTNRERRYGACYLADRRILSEISDRMGNDLYILPSSVHECMVIPVQNWDDPQALASMVREINTTQVSEEEYLADSVYRYSMENRCVEIAA